MHCTELSCTVPNCTGQCCAVLYCTTVLYWKGKERKGNALRQDPQVGEWAGCPVLHCTLKVLTLLYTCCAPRLSARSRRSARTCARGQQAEEDVPVHKVEDLPERTDLQAPGEATGGNIGPITGDNIPCTCTKWGSCGTRAPAPPAGNKRRQEQALRGIHSCFSFTLQNFTLSLGGGNASTWFQRFTVLLWINCSSMTHSPSEMPCPSSIPGA